MPMQIIHVESAREATQTPIMTSARKTPPSPCSHESSQPSSPARSTAPFASQPVLYVHNPYGTGEMVCVGRIAKKSNKLRKGAEGISIIVESAETAETHTTPAQSRPLESPVSSASVSEIASVASSKAPEEAEQKRRSRKTRKNRSAGLAGDNGERVSVCLDYLKGVCNQKRSRCKYAHPQLSLDAPAPVHQQVGVAVPAEVRVCEVWALTGFCKFGLQCRDYHPAVEEPITKVCAPATTVRMSNASREAACRAKDQGSQCGSDDTGSLHSDETSPSTPTASVQESGTSTVRWWLEVDKLLMNITESNFDATLKRLVGMLWAEEGLQIELLLPILFGKAIENFERLARQLANLCRHLCDLYPEAQRHEFQGQLLRLADRVLHLTAEGMESPVQRVSLRRKQGGTAVFIGELFKLSLVPPVRLQSTLDYCIKRGAAQSDDGSFYVDLASTILRIIGPSVACVLDLARSVKQLNELVGMHCARREEHAIYAARHY